MSVFTNTIGIDVSKDKLDVHDHKLNQHTIFENKASGFKQMLDWVKASHGKQLEHILFCYEDTGMYSLSLSLFMENNKLAYSVVAGLEIKRSIGITRGKNDKIDALKIAQYAYLRREEIPLTKMASKIVLKLKSLLTIREKMVKDRGAYQKQLKDLATFYSPEKDTILFEGQKKMIQELNKQVKLIEGEMKRLIAQDPAISKNFELATSVKGIGLILGVALIVYSNNFSRFKTWRQFASYVGTAPFEYESGSSIKKGKRVSALANKRMKGLLSNAATSNIAHNPEMKLYYEKKIKEGKNKMLVQNIIRNKIIARVFAVVKRGTPYVNTLNYAA